MQNFKNGYAVDFLSISQKKKILNWAHVFVLSVFVLESSYLGLLIGPLPVAAEEVQPEGAPLTECVEIDECADILGPEYNTVAKWEWNGVWQEDADERDPEFAVLVKGNAITASWTADPAVAKVIRKAGSNYATLPGGFSGTVVKCNTLSSYCSEISYLTFCDGDFCGNGQIDENETCDDGNLDANDGCSPACQIESGTLIVKKEIGYGTAKPEDFMMQINGIDAFSGSSEGTATSVQPGVFQVSESGGPTDYSLAFSGDCNASGTVEIGYNQTKTCVLTNTYNPKPGQLLVRKIVVGGRATSSDWTMEIAGQASFPGSADGTLTELKSGEMYQVGESGGPAGYALSYQDGCSEAGFVAISPEETSVCTLVNTHLSVCGDELKEGGEACDWGAGNTDTCSAGYGETCQYCDSECSLQEKKGPYCGDGVKNGAEQCDSEDGIAGPYQDCSAECKIVNLPHCGDGNIDAGETCDLGSDQNGQSCSPAYDGQCTWCSDNCQSTTEYGHKCGDGNLDAPQEECDDHDLDDGDGCSSECQIEPGTLLVKKIVDNSRGGNALPGNFTMYIKNLAQAVVKAFAGSSEGTASTLEAGNYVVSESQQDNYSLAYSGDCDLATGQITLAPGEAKTCILTNTFTPPPVQTGQLTVKKIVVGGQATSSDWMMHVGANVHFAGSEAGETRGYDLGIYDITESTSTAVAGAYTLSYSGDCADGQVVIEANTPKTCILTNTHVAECGDGLKEGSEDCDDGNLENNDGCSAACRLESNIQGCKYNDEDGSGTIDEGELKIPNWEIGLWTCPYSPLPAGGFSLLDYSRFVAIEHMPGTAGFCTLVATTTTNQDGCYSFSGLETGDYGVAEVQNAAWTQTFPASSTAYYFNLQKGEATTTVDFANHINPFCGDGAVNQPSEECDLEAGVSAGFHCLSTCLLEADLPTAYCGDGIKNQVSEECDASDGVPDGYTCRGDCTLRRQSSGGGGTPSYFITTAGDTYVQPTPVVQGSVGAPELRITKEIDRTMANPGDADILYTIRVKNHGSLSAFNVKLEDVLPAGLEYMDIASSSRAWNVGDLLPGEEKLVFYSVKVPESAATGDYENIASASADNHAAVRDAAVLEVVKVKVLAATGMSYLELSYLGLIAFLFVQSGRLMREMSAKARA